MTNEDETKLDENMDIVADNVYRNGNKEAGKTAATNSVKSECSETESARPMSSASPTSSNEEPKTFEPPAPRPTSSSSSSACSTDYLIENPDFEPARPTRYRDDGLHLPRVKKSPPTYCNLPEQPREPNPPTLPRRQPNLRGSYTSPVDEKRRAPPPPPPPPPPIPTVAHSHGFSKQDFENRPQDYFSGISSTISSSGYSNIYQNQVVIEKRNFSAEQSYKRRNQVRNKRRAVGTGSFFGGSSGNGGSSSCRCRLASGSSTVNDGSQHGDIRNNPESVVLLYSRFCPGAIEWAKYLTKLFIELSKHKRKLNVRHLPLEDIADSELPHQFESEIFESKLQILLLSPTLLQFVSQNPKFLLGRLLQSERVLAIMLGVKDSQILPEHRSGLVSFSQWIHLEAKDHDLEFVQTVLYFCTQILNRSNNANPNQVNRSKSLNNKQKFENNIFHIHPKKVNVNHRRVVIIFESPQSSYSKFRLKLEQNHPSLPDVELDEFRLMNPYNIQVTIPDTCFSMTNLAALRVEVDGVNRGTRIIKLESPLSELDHLLKGVLDPMDFMCQTMGIKNKDQLDQILTKTLVEKIPKNGFANLKLIRENVEEILFERDDSEFPTLLHFSAFYGLENLTTLLLECPGVRIAIDIKNNSDMAPPELAHLNGHVKLAEKLFNKQNEFNNVHVYDYIKQSKVNNIRDDHGLISQSQYQIPPPPRPVQLSFPCNDQKHQAPGDVKDTVSSESQTVSPKVQKRKSSFLSSTLRFRNSSKKDENSVAEQPKYQQVKSPPRPVLGRDPFGTLRGSNRIKKGEKDTNSQNFNEQDLGFVEDDVFLPSTKPATTQVNNNNDPFGTHKANKAYGNSHNMDYRENNKADLVGYEAELAITNELLKLLEEFRNKNLTVKEMEFRFDAWRRKAAALDTPERNKPSDMDEKLKKYKSGSSSTLMRLFKFHGNNNNIYTNQKSESDSNSKVVEKSLKEPIPTHANESVLNEGDLSIIHENDMSVVALPPTPDKPSQVEPGSLISGVSTQILPLSRLSLSNSSSNGSVTPQANNSSPKGDQNESRSSPVRDKIKNLAEPLKQYFQDLQVSTTEFGSNDEPEILNTPKSVSRIAEEEGKPSSKDLKKPRKLFKKDCPADQKQYENMPPITITDM